MSRAAVKIIDIVFESDPRLVRNWSETRQTRRRHL